MLRVRAILPKESKELKRKVDKAFRYSIKKLATRVNKTYDELVSDWRDDRDREIDVRPEFKQSFSKKRNGWLLEVKTDSEKYRYVDLGTDRHDIPPRPDNPTGLLVFPRNFTPRTTVGSLQKRSGGKSGPLVFTPYVKDHPGNKARNFEAPIIKEQIPLVLKDLRKGLKKAMVVETEQYG